MINSSRLTQATNLNSTRPSQDEAKGVERGFGKMDEELAPADGLLAGGMFAPNAALGKTSPFNELLQLSKLDPKKDVVANKPEQKASADNKDNKRNDTSERKSKTEGSSSKKTAKESKAKSSQGQKQNNDEQLALAQLLTPQQIGALDPLKNKTQVALNGNEKLNTTKLQQVSTIQNDPKNLQDVMQNLDQKIENISQLNSNLQTQSSSKPKDELMELASKFDDVKFEFNPNATQSGQLNKAGNGQMLQEMQNKEMLQKLAEQEWAQNDLALRDLVSQHAVQEAAMEQISLDRLDSMSRLKESQLDRLQMQSLENAAFEKQPQLQEINSAKQPQWQSYKEFSPDELAMLDALAGAKPETGAALGARSDSTGVSSAISSRLMGGESSAPVGKAITQDAVTNLQSLAGLASGSSQGNSSGNSSSNNSSMSGNTSRGETTAVGGVSGQKADATKGSDLLNAAEEKKEARTRESERTREMARAASLRAQSIAAELAVKGGGTAVVQIKDSQLGVVELRINMSDDNRLKVELVANSERIKQELEKQSEELKTGLEKHKLVLEGVSFATDAKLGESGFQNSSQSDSRNQQSQQQQQQHQPQQGFNSFSQNQSSAGQQGFGQERFFQSPNMPLNNAAPVSGAAKKNYTGKNDSQTNIQRNANGSLKVTA
ncbi:MAG: hypothetical protein FJY29_07930 [Betaproteobacteria bacterium]|nr:hypothetical protein [Betaproteobacteria bacterium]